MLKPKGKEKNLHAKMFQNTFIIFKIVLKPRIVTHIEHLLGLNVVFTQEPTLVFRHAPQQKSPSLKDMLV